MKGLFKFIFGLIFFVLIVVVVVVGGTYFLINDANDEAPIELYTSDVNKDDVIDEMITKATDSMATDYAINLELDEESINKIIYSLIKEKVNTQYDPINGTTDEQKYIKSDIKVDSTVPVIGGKKIIIKNAYAKFDDNEIKLSLTANVLDLISTKITFGFELKTTESDFVLTAKTAKLGNVNLLSSFGKTLFSFSKGFIGLNEDDLNEQFASSDVPFVIDLDNFSISISKVEVANIINEMFNSDGSDSYATLVNDFVGVLTKPENNMIRFEILDNKIKLGVDLNKLKVSEEELVIDEEIKEDFNNDLFIKNKVQSFIITNLSTGEKKINFTEVEFSKLIYNQTNGYESFKMNTMIADKVEFNFAVEGIVLDIYSTYVEIKLILNINGLKTTAKLVGEVIQVNDKEINIKLSENISFGVDIQIGSGFIVELLSESMSDFDIMKFDKEKKSFIITAEAFNGFISATDSTSAVEVEKIAFSENNLFVYLEYSDPILGLLIDNVTDTISTILSDDSFLDESEFIVEGDQQNVIQEIKESLSQISDIIVNPSEELTEEDTADLIEAVGNLSAENQEIFINQIQSQFSTDELLNLYNQMFGK